MSTWAARGVQVLTQQYGRCSKRKMRAENPGTRSAVKNKAESNAGNGVSRFRRNNSCLCRLRSPPYGSVEVHSAHVTGCCAYGSSEPMTTPRKFTIFNVQIDVLVGPGVLKVFGFWSG